MKRMIISLAVGFAALGAAAHAAGSLDASREASSKAIKANAEMSVAGSKVAAGSVAVASVAVASIPAAAGHVLSEIGDGGIDGGRALWDWANAPEQGGDPALAVAEHGPVASLIIDDVTIIADGPPRLARDTDDR